MKIFRSLFAKQQGLKALLEGLEKLSLPGLTRLDRGHGVGQQHQMNELFIVRAAQPLEILPLNQPLHRGGDVGFRQAANFYNILGGVLLRVVGEKEQHIQLNLGEMIFFQHGSLHFMVQQLQGAGMGKKIPGHRTKPPLAG